MKLWNPFRQMKRILPHGLFGRSLLIVVTPLVILQGIVTYEFFVRHQDLMTQQMAKGAAIDCAICSCEPVRGSSTRSASVVIGLPAI